MATRGSSMQPSLGEGGSVLHSTENTGRLESTDSTIVHRSYATTCWRLVLSR